MKYLFALILCLVATQPQAAIYVCKDKSQHKTYQDEPCTTQTVGQLAHVPDASLEDQMRVQQSIRSANEQYISRMQKLKDEQLAQLEYEKRLVALEVEKRKLLALDQAEPESPQVVIYNRWHGGYGIGKINRQYKSHKHLHRDQFDGTSHWPNHYAKPNLLVRGARSQGLSIEYRR